MIKNVRVFAGHGSWYRFFKNNFQYSVRKLFFEKPCSLWDLDGFFKRLFVLRYGYDEGCFFKIDPDLFFRDARKADADVNTPAIISHADRRVERTIILVFIIVHHGSRSGIDGDYLFFWEFSLAALSLPGNCLKLLSASAIFMRAVFLYGFPGVCP